MTSMQYTPVTPPLPARGAKYQEYKRRASSASARALSLSVPEVQKAETTPEIGLAEASSAAMVSAIRIVTGQKIMRETTICLPETSEASAETNQPRKSATMRLIKSTVSSTDLSPTPPSLALKLKEQPKAINGVPILVEACLRYFKSNATDCEGLFRIPGNAQHVQRIWDFMAAHPIARVSVNCMNVYMRTHRDRFTPHDVASFLKRFIKSVVGGESVVTYNCYGPLVDLIREKCPADLIGVKYRKIIGQLLVPARRLLLGRLCSFLLDFSKHSATTGMDCRNLAVCFGNLMQPPTDNYTSVSDKKVKHKSWSPIVIKRKYTRARSHASMTELLRAEGEKTKLCVAVLKTLIEQADQVFVQCLSPLCFVSPIKPIK